MRMLNGRFNCDRIQGNGLHRFQWLRIADFILWLYQDTKQQPYGLHLLSMKYQN